MPRGEQYEPTQPPASLIDTYYGGGDAVGIAMLFLNPFIAFGEEGYHEIKDAGDTSGVMKEIDEKVERKYVIGLAKENYRKSEIGNNILELQYEDLKSQYEQKKSNPQTSRKPRKAGTTRSKPTQKGRSSYAILIDNSGEYKGNINLSG